MLKYYGNLFFIPDIVLLLYIQFKKNKNKYKNQKLLFCL